MAMDEAAMLADIASRQQMDTRSDQGSDTKAPTNPFELVRQRILSQPEAKTRSLSDFEREEILRQQREHENRQAVDRLERTVGQKYSTASISNWRAETPRQQEVRAAVIEYCRSVGDRVRLGEGVLLYGPVGTGKDHIAVGIARACCLAGLKICWLKGQEFFGKLRDAMDESSDRSEKELFRDFRSDVLFLSDPIPPVGPLSPYQATMLYRLVDEHYSRGGVVVATVNVSGDEEADKRMGPQTWDRLKDRAWQIKCEWKSFRKPARVV